ncbi:MAG: hypothetical protein V7638_3991 [Acidobacteriota bacterium]
MRPENIEAVYPLSSLQQGLLFHTLLAPRSGVYVVQVCSDLSGDLNIEAFENAWSRLIERHSVFRTFFIWEDISKPAQVVQRSVTLPIELLDWRHLGEAEQNESFNDLLQQDREKGFELSVAPLMRVLLVRVGESAYKFVWSHHHLLLDGWCLSLVLSEVLMFYTACCEKRELQLERGPDYRDYIVWLQRQDLTAAEKFWRRTLGDFKTPTPFGVDRPAANGAATEQDYNSHWSRLSNNATTALQALTRQHKLTMNTIVQGAWGLLLSRYSGQSDVVFGTTVSGRPAELPGVESIVGLFINTLPVRVRVREREPVFSWLQELQQQQVEAREYEYSPLLEVQRWSNVPPGQALFESTMTFENYPVNMSSQPTGSMPQQQGLGVGSLTTLNRPHYPISVTVVPESSLVVKITYDRRRFDDATVERMLEHFKNLLEGIAATPEARVSELSILSARERQQQLFTWNQTATELPAGNLVQLFEEQVARRPEQVAIVSGDERVTYVELDRRANALALELRRCGVGPDVLVGICMERSVELIVSLLGVLKAGGAYLPLDPAYPKERLQFIIDDAGPKVILTTDRTDQSRGSNPDPCHPRSSNLAYVIYTSGSSGTPKGAMVTHGGVINSLQWKQQRYQLSEQDAFLMHTSLNFDPSVWEVFWPLMVGARVVIAPAGPLESSALLKYMAEHSVTCAYFVPSMLGVLVQQPRLSQVSSLRYVINGGEKLPLGVMQEFQRLSRAQLIHSYGPTEVTVGATEWPCEAEAERVLIGRPIGNVHVYVLDGQMEPLPLGVAGELYIGGIGVGRGYVGQPALTAEKFIPDPFSGRVGARLYRTGDMVRYDDEAHLEFVGRLDEQVKLRGYRIELGEIEVVLRRHQQVRETVVVMREESGEKRLVAYVVSEAGPNELRDFLRQHLPEYMIPTAWVQLEALPLTANGKVNRRALPDPDSQRPELSSAYIAPRTSVEREIAEVWQEVLGLEAVGIDDNFFDLGGHSLHAIRVHGKLCAKFGNELSLVQLFQFPTISALAGLLTQKTAAEPALEKVYERASKQREAIAQQRQRIEERRRIYG